jgi:hypothetical protein
MDPVNLVAGCQHMLDFTPVLHWFPFVYSKNNKVLFIHYSLEKNMRSITGYDGLHAFPSWFLPSWPLYSLSLLAIAVQRVPTPSKFRGSCRWCTVGLRLHARPHSKAAGQVTTGNAIFNNVM